ncbi:hypothetical protein BH10BAC6_BH10BAC6_13100 [soil metagenome]
MPVTLILFVLATLPLFSQLDNAHERMMERAHPTPVAHPEYEGLSWNPPFVVQGTFPSYFLNVNVIGVENDQSPTQNESSIAIDPLNPKRLIASAVDYRGNSSTWVYNSTDGGRTWTNTNLGLARPNWQSNNDPSVAFDRTGRGYLCYGGFNRTTPALGENGIFVSITTDGGATWGTKHVPVIQHIGQQTPDSAFEDKYYVQADTVSTSPFHNRLYIPWKRVINRDSSTQIVIARSTNSGLTWTTPVNVSDRFLHVSEDTTYGQSFPLARTSPDGNVHVVWNSGTEKAIRYARSVDGGVSFTAPSIIQRYRPYAVATTINGTTNHRLKGTVRAETYPSLSVDNTNGPRRGWLYLVWSADGVPNIYFSRSSDGGTSWSTPTIVHADTTNDQFWPWLCVDPANGDVAVMYSDSRDDAANILVNTYVSLSTNGGTTWTDRRVGDDVNDIRRNPFGGSFSGDYSGCDMLNGLIYPSWVDMRNTYTTPADDDVFTAVINTRAPEAPTTFVARALPSDATKAELEWSPVTKRSFGQELDASLLSFLLYRGTTLIATLPGTSNTYMDSGLQPYTVYQYTLVSVAGSDTASPRYASVTSGGARQPAPPILLTATNDITRALATVLLPTVRADSLTPLSDLAALLWYSDSTVVGTVSLVAADTGSTQQLAVNLQRGWHVVSAAARTTSGATSARSNEIRLFVGSLDGYTERFDSIPRFWVQRGSWGRETGFAKSMPGAYTESPSGPYRASARDTVLIYPTTARSPLGVRMSFWHAAFIDAGDTAFVEYTVNQTDSGWKTLGAYNAASNARWLDTTKGDDAWRFENIGFVTPSVDDTVYVRLRFRSNAARNSDGWYIDDISFEGITSVQSETSHQRSAYPQPATTSCTLGLLPEDDVVSVALVAPSGQDMTPPWKQEQTSLVLDVRSCAPGIYAVEASTIRGIIRQTIIVAR